MAEESPSNKPQNPNTSGIAKNFSDASRGYLKNMLLKPDISKLVSDTMRFMFSPKQVSEKLRANYQDFAPVGMSGEFQSFRNTVGPVISFALYWNSLMYVKDTGVTLDEAHDYVEASRRFLEASVLPAAAPSGVITGETAPFILCLPGILTLRVKVQDVNITFDQLDQKDRLREVRATVSFKEAPLGRITMQDHLEVGMVRTWGE